MLYLNYHKFKKMYLFFKNNLTKTNFFNLLLALMPFAFIAGNMIINIITILIIFFTIILFGKNLFKIKYQLLDKIIFLFFSFIIFTALINDIFYLNKLSWGTPFATTLKSILFLKYLLLFIVLKFLVEKNIINFKIFFLSCSFAALFVCFDIFYQYIFGKDIFGYEMKEGFRKLSGPFGDELIAGGYIQRFSIFALFTIPLFYENVSSKILKFLIPLLLIIVFLALILSGNRMSFILFIFLITLVVFFHGQTRKYFLPFILSFSLIFLLIFNFNQKVKSNFGNFYGQVSTITKTLLNQEIDKEKKSTYLKDFATFYDTWLMNKYIGGGIKSFRYYCHVRPSIDKNLKVGCNMHPHNYYFELLTETGLIGFILAITIFGMTLYRTFYKKYFVNSSFFVNNKIIIPFIFLFIAEIFPIKSTGSFFTTGNATYIFLIMAILVGLASKEKIIENKF